VVFRIHCFSVQFEIVISDDHGELEARLSQSTNTHVFDQPGEYYIRAVGTDIWGERFTVPGRYMTVRGSSWTPPSPSPTSQSPGTPNDLPYEEDFSGGVSGWSSGDDEDFTYGVGDGHYSTTVRKVKWAKWVWAPPQDIDFGVVSIVTDVTLAGGSIGWGGIIWGPSSDDFMVFAVDHQGRYKLSKHADDAWQTSPIPATSSVAIHPAESTNHLQLILKEGMAILLANDKLLDAVSTEQLEDGRIGLYTSAGDDDDAYCEAWFDNLYITDEPENLAPVAGFELQYSEDDSALVSCDASASYDPDGSITQYRWAFGDGESGYGETISHRYARKGTYPVTLTVCDGPGLESQTSDIVTISNRPPWPSFTLLPSDPVEGPVQFDASESYDPDGSIERYKWDFGDGGEGTGRTATHTYTEAGSYLVSLEVVDSDGAEMSLSKMVVVQEGNDCPVAHFTWMLVDDSGTRLMVEPRVGKPLQFDASTSADSDGEIVEYAWDWDGDGTYDETTTEPVTDHWFEDEGVRDVTLRVTDDDGGAGTYAEAVTILAAQQIVEPDGVLALVVGVSDYTDVNDLTYARSDAEAFARWLIDAGVSVDSITLLLDEAGELEDLGLHYDTATLSRFRAGLGWLRKQAKPDDLVFVYFAGHGYQGEDDDGDEADGVDEFLVLHDTMRSAVEETALRDDEFGAFLDRVGSDHVMVVFDSCHSGGQSRSLSSGSRPLGDTFDLFNDFSLEGKLILAAAREDQEALEHEGLGHGLFTHFLLQGLKGDADLDSDYRITAEELHAYVSTEVERYAWEVRGREQTPEMTGRGEVGIVVSRTNRPPEAAFAIEPETPYAYGITNFTDESTDDTEVVSWSWDLGDGTTSTEPCLTHIYEKACSYTVSLTVTDSEGETSTSEQEIVIGPPGEVTTVAGDTIVISLGTANGIEVGDRFEVVRILALSSGQAIEEHKATIEVIEILDADRSACRVINSKQPIQVGDVVRRED